MESTDDDHNDLRYVITNIDDAVITIAGWAEAKRCDECKEPVALLFDDAFLETRGGEGVICCECYRRNRIFRVTSFPSGEGNNRV